MLTSSSDSMNSKYTHKRVTSNDSDLSKIVAMANDKIQSNMTPMALTEESISSSLRPYEMRKNYQQEKKTSVEIINETRSMLANGKVICIIHITKNITELRCS